MQQGLQATPRKFLIRLSLLAGGAMALSSATGLLTGCGGGGGGGISSPTPAPSTPPTLPNLATITPQTPAEAASTFQNKFGVATTVDGVAGPPVTDVTQSLTNVLTLETLAIPTFTTGADGAATGVTLQSAGDATVTPTAAFPTGLTITDLRNLIRTLVTATEYVQLPGSRTLTRVPVIQRGDVPIFITFKQNDKTFKTIAFRHQNGRLGFNVVLSSEPGRSELRQVPSNQDENDRLNNNGSTVESVITNRNPYDGHVHYEFVLSAQAAFDRQTGDATVTKPMAKVEILGPFVSATPPTVPTIVAVASSLQVRTTGGTDYVTESDDTFTYRYGRHEVWRREEKNKIKIHKKKRTGSTGHND